MYLKDGRSIVVTMFVDDNTETRGRKKYRRVLLRNSYRKNGKVKHDTIANLTHCSDEEIEAIKWALKNKGKITSGALAGDFQARQGISVGSVWLLFKLAERLGIRKALGESREGRLCLLMVLASIIGHNSRLSIVRNSNDFAFCDVLGLDAFNEDDLYAALDWLCDNQATIEKKLFSHRYGKDVPVLYLYDVTSSYLEGRKNELAAFGYNRDGKKGKMQIVIGLLADGAGCPVSTGVFAGNTQDVRTVKDQIDKLKKNFGAEKIAFVGDRGMLKRPQQDDLKDEGFNYITAITKPQIETLLKRDVIQMDMFDEDATEVEDGEIRYILKRNPVRVQQIDRNRRDKLRKIRILVEEQNLYLSEHVRASTEVALKNVVARIGKLKLNNWLSARAEDRSVVLELDEKALAEEALLDGCYVIKTDLKKEDATKEIVHQRYKDLARVEWGFRTMKSTFLELRGIYVTKEKRTRAHVLVVMLAYLLQRELYECWRELEVTVAEGVRELTSLCSLKVSWNGRAEFQTIPEPRERGSELLKAAGFTLPDALPSRNVRVDTRKKLVPERKNAENSHDSAVRAGLG